MVTGPKISATVQTNTPTTDAFGGKTESWATVETIHKAVLIAKKGDERFVSGRDNVISDFVLYLNGRKSNRLARTIVESQRIKYGTRIFDIVFVENVGQMGVVLKVHLREIV